MRSDKYMLPVTYQFIKDNWILVRSLWNDNTDNTIYYCDADIHDRLLRKQNLDRESWSCFFAADFILDLYGVYNRQTHNIIIDDVDSFKEQFEPGYIYKFGILDHNFVVVYLADNQIYYTDYYAETGRYKLYRFELMPRESVIDYVKDYTSENFDRHTEFHKADKKWYQKSYVREYYDTKTRCAESNYHKMEYEKFMITCEPTIKDVVRVIENSVTEETFIEYENMTIDDLFHTDYSNIGQWKEERNKLLLYLEDLARQ